MPNVQWMSYSFVRLYLIKCVVYVLNCMFDQTKKIFNHFICIWKWFLLLFVFLFIAYFVFIVLSMFCVEKQMLEFLATLVSNEFWLLILATHSWVASFGRSFWWLIQESQVHPEAFATRLVAKRPESVFKEFFMGNLF